MILLREELLLWDGTPKDHKMSSTWLSPHDTSAIFFINTHTYTHYPPLASHFLWLPRLAYKVTLLKAFDSCETSKKKAIQFPHSWR